MATRVAISMLAFVGVVYAGFATAGPDVQEYCTNLARVTVANADCLSASRSNNNTSLTAQNTCTRDATNVLGTVVMEVAISNWNLDLADGTTQVGDLYSQHTLSTSASRTYSFNDPSGNSEYFWIRCCKDDGICYSTDCDTTDGVIDDLSNAPHCNHVDDTTGELRHGFDRIEDGVVYEAEATPAPAPTP